jgi:thiamine biosynthesis lipoprotein
MTSDPSRKKNLLFAIALSAAAAAIISTIVILSSSSVTVEKTGLMMGTIVHVKTVARGDLTRVQAEAAVEMAFAEMARVEGVFSVYKTESEISRINRLKAGESIVLSEETFGLIDRSVGYSAKTGGAFDITVKPLVDLWARAKSEGRLPTSGEIDTARDRVGSQYIILDKGRRMISFAKDGMALDLGGVAKGYAADRATAGLRANGVKDAIVNAGGDAYCLGRKSALESWKVGVRHPRKPDALVTELPLENRAIDTSGDYEKFFVLGGKRYSHIIDPRSGYPVGDDVVSATVLAPDSTTADALATALCVLGESGMKLIESDPSLDAIIISMRVGRLDIVTSKGLREYGKSEKGL